jgi:hypothetical protein
VEITLKSGCSFKVKSYLLSSKHWSLNVVNGEHNHDMTQYFQGHKYVKRLRLTENMALPRNIMSALKNGQQASNLWLQPCIKHIYNACYRLKKSSQGSRTEMQHLMKCLLEGKYL